LRIAKEQLPDIVLLDMMIPKISGPDVLKALKENPATTHIPVIVLSSLSQQNEERLIGQGAAAYFEKSTLESTRFRPLATTIQSVSTELASKASHRHSSRHPPAVSPMPRLGMFSALWME